MTMFLRTTFSALFLVSYLSVALSSIVQAKTSTKNSYHPRSNAKEAEGPSGLSSIGFYAFQNKTRGPCPPCANKNLKVPARFGLSKANPKSFGSGKTYYLLNDDDLNGLGSQVQQQIGRTVRPKRTGYSTANNSGNNHAGWAAVRRSGETGINNFGSGTLDNPRTIAVSPTMASAQGICQGDMIFDCQFGWMRAEGGCTANEKNGDALGNRIDVWMGGMSTTALNSDSAAWITRVVEMKVFPAGLIPQAFASKYSAPKQKQNQMPQGCFE